MEKGDILVSLSFVDQPKQPFFANGLSKVEMKQNEVR
jgi:hypothetical protein